MAQDQGKGFLFSGGSVITERLYIDVKQELKKIKKNRILVTYIRSMGNLNNNLLAPRKPLAYISKISMSRL